jgi:serine/threonine protein kinase
MIRWIDQPMPDDAASGPARIGRYTIVAPLGEGGQAETFRAVHPGFQSTVVLKIAKHPADPGMLDRIALEGRLLASLPQHRHLVRVHDVDFHEGRVFLVLEDVPGTTLKEYVKDRPLDARWIAQVVAAIARAVHLAHEQGIIHQDLNPKNVLIDREGQPRVIDFGVAWYRPWWSERDDPTQLGGTLSYFAPEQASGQVERIGRATDVFGLGGILFFLLTGSPPYTGDDVTSLLTQAREANFDRSLLDRPEIPPRLREICLKALAREPRDRFATAADLAQALEEFLAPRRWRYLAILATLFLLSFGLMWVMSVGRPAQKASLHVRVWRRDTQYQTLLQALPVRTGDELQVRFRAPTGLHLALFSINGRGRLYPAPAVSTSARGDRAGLPGPRPDAKPTATGRHGGSALVRPVRQCGERGGIAGGLGRNRQLARARHSAVASIGAR